MADPSGSRPSIQEVGDELRRRRRALVGYEQPTREGWEADLVAYDLMLVDAAAMLEVPVPGLTVGTEPLPARQRDRLETALAAAGMDIRTDDL
ncbi:MAG: hypothetical protein M3535_07145 [Actinomycetota bacterium]|nr:hypothetical protein [Actinomycetota bacterium]MDQ3353962.1 hypothetical protein [Actinomycetota bacterium]